MKNNSCIGYACCNHAWIGSNEYNKGFQCWIDLKKCKKGAKIQVKVNGWLIKPLD